MSHDNISYACMLLVNINLDNTEVSGWPSIPRLWTKYSEVTRN